LVEVDGKGNFAADLKVSTANSKLGKSGNVYKISFKAAAGETYALTIDKPSEKYGLYSVTASYLK
jgi:hypothetical protein